MEMTAADVRKLRPAPAVICVGGNDEWKWGTVEEWVAEFDHVHLLRCNSPKKLPYLKAIGAKSTDGSGWNRGDRNQDGRTRGFLPPASRRPFLSRSRRTPVDPNAGPPASIQDFPLRSFSHENDSFLFFAPRLARGRAVRAPD